VKPYLEKKRYHTGRYYNLTKRFKGASKGGLKKREILKSGLKVGRKNEGLKNPRLLPTLGEKKAS